MEYEKKNTGVAKAGLTTGIIGTSLGAMALLGGGASLLNGGNDMFGRNNAGQAYLDGVMMSALMGRNGCGCGQNAGSCNEDHFVTRYDAQKDARIAELETQVALRDSNTYTDQKMLQLYQYVDGRLRGIEGQICQQAVINQATQDKFQLVQQEAQCCCDKTNMRVDAEIQARCCADNAIVNYANATFYPQLIADITAGTTTRPQETWNPLPNCGCRNNNG